MREKSSAFADVPVAFILYEELSGICICQLRKDSKRISRIVQKQGESMIDTTYKRVGACENIIMIQKYNKSKLINDIGKMKGKEKNNIKGKDLIDLIKHKFWQLEEKLHGTLNDRGKKVTSNEPINKSIHVETILFF